MLKMTRNVWAVAHASETETPIRHQPHPDSIGLPPPLTVLALLLGQRRGAGGAVRVLAGQVLGHEGPPVALGHGRDGREEGEGRRGVQLLLRQVVVLRGVAFVQQPRPRPVGVGRGLGAAPSLLGQGGGRADAGQGVGLGGLRGPVLGGVLQGRGAEAGVRGVLSGDGRGGGLVVGLGEGAEAATRRDLGQRVPGRQVLVQEVIVRVVVLRVVWEREEGQLVTSLTSLTSSVSSSLTSLTSSLRERRDS